MLKQPHGIGKTARKETRGNFKGAAVVGLEPDSARQKLSGKHADYQNQDKPPIQGVGP
jgi:hypothetical protein